MPGAHRWRAAGGVSRARLRPNASDSTPRLLAHRAARGLLRRRVDAATTKEHHITEPRINERIRVPEVRLVGPNGEQVGIVRVEDALRLAAEADLDLVEVAPTARPPVAKLMDFGKFKYEQAMKAREARKNQVNTVIKEIKLRPKIDPHDYGTKKGHVERFLRAGDKVKVTIMFRGREQSRPELGFRLLQRLAEDVIELGYVESAPKQDGRNMIMVLGPTKKKSEAKAEARRARETVARSDEGAGTSTAAVATGSLPGSDATATNPATAPASSAPAAAAASPVAESSSATPSAAAASPVAESSSATPSAAPASPAPAPTPAPPTPRPEPAAARRPVPGPPAGAAVPTAPARGATP
ncbi:MAG: translation initiation factor IF-3 [Dermatophilaceae bacterium]